MAHDVADARLRAGIAIADERFRTRAGDRGGDDDAAVLPFHVVIFAPNARARQMVATPTMTQP
jgi:hypothetical protein